MARPWASWARPTHSTRQPRASRPVLPGKWRHDSSKASTLRRQPQVAQVMGPVAGSARRIGQADRLAGWIMGDLRTDWDQSQTGRDSGFTVVRRADPRRRPDGCNTVAVWARTAPSGSRAVPSGSRVGPSGSRVGPVGRGAPAGPDAVATGSVRVGESQPDRHGSRLHAARDTELREDVPDVHANGLLADEQALADLPVPPAPGKLDEDPAVAPPQSQGVSGR